MDGSLSPEAKFVIDLPEDDIRAGRVCPYCGHPPSLISTDFGKRWECNLCDARVGVHKGTEIPLGSLANRALREKRKELHEYFDQMWRFAQAKRGIEKHEARNAAYKWLANEMDMPQVECHIGMMDLEECMMAIRLCKPYFKEKIYI